ncbi:DUF3750 domain-containing protein [Bosea sp. TWI1241]|jgi:hypothetical protein|uniref:DUF3750 domain-containing protein n=1 Tax=Bosea sp. TWI1241 TaxID=3148904 RepID=UPI003207A0D3
MRTLRAFLLLFLVAFLLPLASHALWWTWQPRAPDWRGADWSSARLLPVPATEPEATVHVFAARVGRWRGIFAHHSWVVVKEAGADAYTRFDVVGWGNPVRVNVRVADGRWFGNLPELVAEVRGREAEALIPRIRAAVRDYPYDGYGSYAAWPGPNSNSFVQHILAAVPELGRALPPTAIGKDWRAEGIYAGTTPSRTGLQASLYGLLGVSLGWVEGVEVNLLGLVAGLDLRRPAVKLPGWGRIGL